MSPGRIVEENLQAFASYYLRPYSPLSPAFLGGNWSSSIRENEQHRLDEELNRLNETGRLMSQGP